MRLDLWLWSVRVYRSRSIAVTAIRSGHVTVNGLVAKPAREVHPDERIVARVGDRERILRVIGDPPSRIGAPLVPLYAEDLTPAPVPVSDASTVSAPVGFRPRGAGRPTKRDRRRIEDFLD
jgi:ribosome-associated heat shock protein Hsp15